jgi:hypothetical protein
MQPGTTGLRGRPVFDAGSFERSMSRLSAQQKPIARTTKDYDSMIVHPDEAK